MVIAKLVCGGSRPLDVEISSEQLPLLVGRGPQVGLRIPDRWTSRRHCELNEVDGVLWVYDLGSTHGTFVNGGPTQQAPLADGDTLHVGLWSFRICYQPSGTPD